MPNAFVAYVCRVQRIPNVSPAYPRRTTNTWPIPLRSQTHHSRRCHQAVRFPVNRRTSTYTNLRVTSSNLCQRMSTYVNVCLTYHELTGNLCRTYQVHVQYAEKNWTCSKKNLRARPFQNFNSVSQRALNVNDVSPTYPKLISAYTNVFSIFRVVGS